MGGRAASKPAGLPKDVEAALIDHLEKTISSKEHKAKAEALALDPQIIKGEPTASSSRTTSRPPRS